MDEAGDTPKRILLVEDDPLVRASLSRHLQAAGFVVAEAATCTIAQSLFRSFGPDVVLTDYVLPDGNGIALGAELRRERPALPVVVLTGHASIDLAVHAMKCGAETLLAKPVEMERLVAELNEAIADEVAPPPASLRQRDYPGPLRGLFAPNVDLDRIKDIDCSLLVLGETGVGKTQFARWLHDAGVRRGKPFVELSCEDVCPADHEAELFGYMRGAVPSATAGRAGLFESASGGTLLLDELGDLPLASQAKVLEVVQGKRVRRLGSARERPVDVRVLATTRRDLRDPATALRLRPDLVQCLGAVTISIPSLRDRRAEIPCLARDILASLSSRRGCEPPALSDDADALLASHAWPGNVRELTRVLAAALELGARETLRAEDLTLEPAVDAAPESSSLRDIERAHIERALAQYGHVGDAARSLGISRSSLYVKAKAYGLPLPGGSRS